jgi:four helix bundle protein
MNRQINSYRDLVAWQKGMSLVEVIYRETRCLPSDELYGLNSQLRRAAVSVPSNIAEGWGRHRTPDYLRFLRMAQGSMYEISTQAEICRRLAFNGDWNLVENLLDELRRIMHGLIRSLETN